MHKRYPHTFLEKASLFIYKLVWILSFPIVIAYFFKRSLKESSYRLHFRERLGVGPHFKKKGIWIHAVSLGEFRAAMPLITKLLERNERIIITTITPAGREEAQRALKEEILEGEVLVLYLPLEYSFSISLFIKRYRPRLGIILEYELWPVLISSCQKNGIPLVLAQAHYVKKSFLRDKKTPWMRGAVLKGFSLILAKSELHAERFREFTDFPVDVMGELRFEQVVDPKHLKKANEFIQEVKRNRPSRICFCFGSTGPGEDHTLINIMVKLKEKAHATGKRALFFVYVPRHKKDFKSVKKFIDDSGLDFFSRSDFFERDLTFAANNFMNFCDCDGLYGDSLGEINFYFQMADFVFIGNSFNELGSHNIIEPLALRKPVFVGPSVWGIEYPIVEAERAGVAIKVDSEDTLMKLWWKKINQGEIDLLAEKKIMKFHKDHSGASEKCIAKLNHYGLL